MDDLFVRMVNIIQDAADSYIEPGTLPKKTKSITIKMTPLQRMELKADLVITLKDEKEIIVKGVSVPFLVTRSLVDFCKNHRNKVKVTIEVLND